jgi:DNA repair protein RadC
MAIKSLSKGVIIAHNHPSGEKKPSSADVSMTKNMKTALGLFNIELVDHMIITKDGYYSFLDNGTI